ncbi:MAG TPA: cytochrome c [Herpetosiphonaceae bacterium]
MTRNILIATIFSLATAILLGIIFVSEADRLPEATAAITAEQIERGARDYEQYCATCHGLAGEGGVKFGAPQLNNIVQRYTQSQSGQPAPFDQPNGIKEKYGSMANYIEAILFSGIRGTPMPAWGQPQGPLRPDQITNITTYVLSWNGNVPEAAIKVANRVATEQAPTADPNANPVSQGEIVFTQKGCVGCHAMTDEKRVGPGLGGLFQPDGTAAFGTELPNGKPVNDENVKEWILNGSAGFPENNNDLQGNDYPPMPGFALTDEEYETLSVWLKAHNRDGSLTEEAQQIIEQAKQGTGTGEQPPTAQPTGQANQPGAPNSPAGPGSTATP